MLLANLPERRQRHRSRKNTGTTFLSNRFKFAVSSTPLLPDPLIRAELSMISHSERGGSKDGFFFTNAGQIANKTKPLVDLFSQNCRDRYERSPRPRIHESQDAYGCREAAS